MPGEEDAYPAANRNPPGTMIELLAPAGDRESLDAALAACADAVYFGLSVLNARRRAKNFRAEELADAVGAVHAHGAKAYLTLNIDLAERELGHAVRILELARQSHVDAVLVRDPALFALRPEYPELEFHFSTQTCMANSADVAAAGQLGATRVVLARELSLREIAAASAVPGVETEVFAQGALCFSISGRCLLSSWIGGRSGNRGTCTSPCRVPWTADGEPLGTPLSMRDLAAIERLGAIRDAGVSGLKIEGRLKSAEWVGRAVGLYRRALNGEAISLADVADLGAYTGRTLTCGYLDDQRCGLTAVSGRARSPDQAAGEASEAEMDASGDADAADETDDDSKELDGGCYDLDITISDRAIEYRCRWGERTFEWTMPKTVIHRPHKAVSVADVFVWLGQQQIQYCRLGRATTNAPEFLLVRRAASALQERLSAVLRQARNSLDEPVRIELPLSVRKCIEKDEPAASNVLTLGQTPNRVRLAAADVRALLRQARLEGVIVEGLTARSVEAMQATCGETPLIVALPPVFFEDDIPAVRDLLTECAKSKVVVEVNSWGGWHLARRAGVRMESGPGLPALNSLAARELASLGIRCVTLSPEADRKQLEEATAHCSTGCSLIVFGRPALLMTRADLSEDDLRGKVLADRRGARLTARREHGLWTFRPADPFDLRDCRNERIRVRHLVVDLVGSPDPASDWRNPHKKDAAFHFNYDRTLA